MSFWWQPSPVMIRNLQAYGWGVTWSTSCYSIVYTKRQRAVTESACGLQLRTCLLMFGAWALLKRQYGRLQCLASVGLMFRVYEACVPQTAAYGCEIWVFKSCPNSSAS